jgi:hypothetical protein
MLAGDERDLTTITHQVHPRLSSYPFSVCETELPNPYISYLLCSTSPYTRTAWRWDSGAQVAAAAGSGSAGRDAGGIRVAAAKVAGSWRAAHYGGWFAACSVGGDGG